MKILIYGFYYKQNLGDNLFISAFKFLFLNYELRFVDFIKNTDLTWADAVFIGGGSLLDSPIPVEDFTVLKQKKIFYIGVGTETDLHDMHKDLFKIAKLIATRSKNINNIKHLDNIIQISDLVTCLTAGQSKNIKNSILLFPNNLVIPKWNDLYWKHSSWNYFKCEFAQFLDYLIENKFVVNFMPMCINKDNNDLFAINELINATINRKEFIILQQENNVEDLMSLVSKQQLIISQRYHGVILAEMNQVSSIVIHHHDKLKEIGTKSLSYYGLNKDKLINLFNESYSLKSPKNEYNFDALVSRVNNALCSH